MSDIRDRIAEEHPDVLFCDGYDDCIVGTVSKYGEESVVCYDLDAMIAKLMKDGMTEEEAWEWFEFNIIGGYHGEYTPCFLKLALPDRDSCLVPFMESPVRPVKKSKKNGSKKAKSVGSDKQIQGWVDVITKGKRKK
jgi:hypothetical protein